MDHGFGYLPPELLARILLTDISCTTHDFLAMAKILLRYRLICRTWNQIISNSSYVWKSLFSHHGWDVPQGETWLEAAIDRHVANMFVFFCRACLLPISRVTIASHKTPEEQIIEFNAARAAGGDQDKTSKGAPKQVVMKKSPAVLTKLLDCKFHTDSANELSSNKQKVLREFRRPFFLLTQPPCTGCSVSQYESDGNGGLRLRPKHLEQSTKDISFFHSKMLTNVAFDATANSGCCGFTGFSGTNVRCRGCGLMYITMHSDCMPPVQQHHVPVDRTFAVRLSRAQPSTLSLLYQDVYSVKPPEHPLVFEEAGSPTVQLWKYPSSQPCVSAELMRREELYHDQLRHDLPNLIPPSKLDEFLMKSYEAICKWSEDGCFSGHQADSFTKHFLS